VNALDFSVHIEDFQVGQVGMAHALGIDVKRVRAYASGMRPIPKVVALAAWALSRQMREAEARKTLGMWLEK